MIHNNNASFYDRDAVFSNLGFDNFITIENMDVKSRNEVGWARDSILTTYIMDTLNQTKKKDVIYTISVQGHGDYPTDDQSGSPITVSGEGMSQGYLTQFTYYVNQTREMDDFIKDLTDKLSDYPEDVMVIAYGDHLPGMNLESKDLKTNSKYETPYFIWDNFGYNKENKKKQSGKVEAWQLASKVLKEVGIHNGFLNEYHQTMEEDKKYRKNLKLLQYDMLYGSNFVREDKKSLEPTKINYSLSPVEITENGETVPGARYYVGLFCDAEGTIPYGKNYLKTIDFNGSHSETIKYDNLPDGTYYLFETDENGVPYAMGETHTEQDRTYKCVVGDGSGDSADNKVQLQGRPQGKMNISNVFTIIPEDFLVVAELTIEKKVLDQNGQQTTTNDTFYASVYKQTGSDDNVENELIQTVQLQQNGKVTVPVRVEKDGSTTKVYIEETDADGNTIDRDNFAYKISGEGNVELSMEQQTGTITLTNREKGDEEEETTSSEEETTSTEKEKTPPNNNTKKSKSGKTGDTTPILTWIIIGVAAAVVIIFLVVRRRKSE